MAVIPVDIAGHPYEVRVAPGLLTRVAEECGSRLRKARVPIITDVHVHAAWGAQVEASITQSGKQVAWRILPAG